METALAGCNIEGVATNLSMHRAIMQNTGFRKGGVTTAFFSQALNNLKSL